MSDIECATWLGRMFMFEQDFQQYMDENPHRVPTIFQAFKIKRLWFGLVMLIPINAEIAKAIMKP